MFGLLNVRKPGGATSRDAVNHVQRLVRPAKAGHAGTLDPLATGVLVICVGRATRLVEYVQAKSKQYEGTFLLGRTSDTEDTEGNVAELDNPPQASRADIESVLPQFRGQIMQRPPAFSAKKIAGRRAYQLARRGDEVKLAPRPVTIYQLDILSYDYPTLRMAVTCGSGTYIRSLGRDIAEALGTGAVMSALTRTAIGQFSLDESCSLDELTAESISRILLPPVQAVSHLRQITLSAAQVIDIINGKPVAGAAGSGEETLAAVDDDGHLVGLLRPAGPGRLRPLRCFAER